MTGTHGMKMPQKVSFFHMKNLTGQTVLPDRLILIGQNLVENAKIEKFKCDILSNF